MSESDIFNEFNQPKSIAFFVFLLPLGPILLFVLSHRLGWVPAVIISLCCYLPTLIVAKKRIAVFGTSGTDRTQIALRASNHAYGTAILGLLHISLYLIMTFANYSYPGAA